jgi:hypothetical protein
MENTPKFATEAEAAEYMYLLLDEEECIDNYRFAFRDDDDAMVLYNSLAGGGCCGSSDFDVIVDGKLAAIGCNYGH